MLNNDFVGFSKVKWLHVTGEVDKSVSVHFNFSQDPPKLLESVNLGQSHSKNEKVDVYFFGTRGRHIRM